MFFCDKHLEVAKNLSIKSLIYLPELKSAMLFGLHISYFDAEAFSGSFLIRHQERMLFEFFLHDNLFNPIGTNQFFDRATVIGFILTLL